MTATELFAANRAVATVSSGGTTAPAGGTQETWTVASSAMFGAAATGVSQFHVADVAAPSEVIAVTNVSGTTWTVTRGAESTTPVIHQAGFTVYQVVTAGWLSTVPQPSAVFRSATAKDSGSSLATTVSINVPAGVQDGDLLLCGTFTTADYVTMPNGWNAFDYKDSTDIDLFWRLADSEPASYTITASGSSVITAGMAAYYNVAPGIPAWSVAHSSVDVTTFTAPLPSGIGNSDLVVLFASCDTSAAGNSENLTLPGSPWTTRLAPGSTTLASGNNASLGITDRVAPSVAPAVTSASGSDFFSGYVILQGASPGMTAMTQLGRCQAQSGRMNGMGYMGAVADYYTCSLAAATWTSQTLFISRIDCAAANAPVNGYVSLQWYSQNAGLANAYIGLYDSSGTRLGVTANLASQPNNTWIRVAATGFTQTPADGTVFAVYANGTQATSAGPGALGFGFYDVPIPYAAYPPGVATAGPANVAYGGSFLFPNPSGNTLPSTLPMSSWSVTNILPHLAID